MPHITVKLWPGKSEQQKIQLAKEIAKDVTNILDYGEESVSVAIEKLEPKIGLRGSISPKSLATGRSYSRNLDTLCECHKLASE